MINEERLILALKEFRKAIGRLIEDTNPPTPLPRPRKFFLSEQIVWPGLDMRTWDDIFVFGETYHLYNVWVIDRTRYNLLLEEYDLIWEPETERLAKKIACSYNDQEINRILRRIQRATAWCNARAESREQAAQKILCQRSKLIGALKELREAVKQMVENTNPPTSLPRPRRFYFCKKVKWPGYCSDKTKIWFYVEIDYEGCSLYSDGEIDYIAREIIRYSGGSLKNFIRSLRRIQAAAAWCKARAEGRKRDAQEILCQQEQSRAVKILETELVLKILSSEKRL